MKLAAKDERGRSEALINDDCTDLRSQYEELAPKDHKIMDCNNISLRPFM